MKKKDVVIVTGSSGFIGQNLCQKLVQFYQVIGLDQTAPKEEIIGLDHFDINLTSENDVSEVLAQVQEVYGKEIKSVIHLIAYYDFRGSEDERYQTITLNGTENLLKNLKSLFEVGQFIFSSSMLVYAPSPLGTKISETSVIQPSWAYPKSKVEAEEILKNEHGPIPIVILRIAGVYDDSCHSPTISQQIIRINEGWISSFLFPGNPYSGQTFLHVDDLRDSVVALVQNVKPLSSFEIFVVGEDEVMSFKELQKEIGLTLHHRAWPTIQIPEVLAQTGAWVMEHLPFMREPFVKSWMIKHADESFEIDSRKIKKTLDWEPQHKLKDSLPLMLTELRKDPEAFYRLNKMPIPFYRNLNMIGKEGDRHYFIAAIACIFLGLLVMANPFSFGLMKQGEIYTELIGGALITMFAALSLFPTLRWMRWCNALLGSLLLLSPLVFKTDSAASFSNDTFIGGLVILLSAYTPSLNRTSAIPPGWTYNPSTPGQRLPIMFLAFLGFLISRYLASYQLGHISNVWDPLFSGGTQKVLTSEVSKAFPISDAGLGSLTYLLDVVAACIGGRDRWKTLPWAVILFGLMIIPSGVVSITLIMLQPISVGAWCALCLLTALIMLIMVPPAVDEVAASVEFLLRRKKAGDSFWRVFWFGSDVREESLIPKVRHEGHLSYLYMMIALSIWTMISPWYFSMEGMARTSTYITGSLLITFSIIALSEVARLVRLINIPLGAWLALSGFFYTGMNEYAQWSNVILGFIFVILGLPSGRRDEAYGKMDGFIHWAPLRRELWK